MIRDPLQPGESPFELLGLSSVGATDEEIKKAFNRQMRGAAPKRLKALQQARGTLLRNPQERALLGLFLYEPGIAARLEPNPAKDAEALAPKQRAETARQWSRQFKEDFPNYQKAHALAILWYWNAIRDRERLEAALAANQAADALGKTALTSWTCACAYWVMTLETPAFWKAHSVIPEDHRQEIEDRLVETRLRHNLRDIEQHCRDAGAERLAKRFHALRLDLDTELETARRLAQSGIGIKRRRVACGPLLLGLYGILERMREKVAHARRDKPEDPGLKAIQDALSPYVPIRQMVGDGRFEAALEAIAKLHEAERTAPEVAELALDAYRALGEQQAEMDRFEAALEYWRKARDTAGAAGLSEPTWLRERVSELGKRASNTLAQDAEKVIHVLELACETADVPGLRTKLGALLGQRGWNDFAAALNAWQKGERGDDQLEKLRAGLAALERAEASGVPGIEQQAEQARELMIAIGKYPGLPPEAERLLSRADAAAAKEHWEDACIGLMAALAKVEEKLRGPLRKKLAVMLNNYALGRFNAAAERLANLADIDGIMRVYRDEWESVLDLKHAVELDPSNPTTSQVLGNVTASVGQLEQQLRQNPLLSTRVEQARKEAETARHQRLERWKKGGSKASKRGASKRGSQKSAKTDAENEKERLPGETLAAFTGLLVAIAAGILFHRGDWNWGWSTLFGLFVAGAWYVAWEGLAKSNAGAGKGLLWTSLILSLLVFFAPSADLTEAPRTAAQPTETAPQALSPRSAELLAGIEELLQAGELDMASELFAGLRPADRRTPQAKRLAERTLVALRDAARHARSQGRQGLADARGQAAEYLVGAFALPDAGQARPQSALVADDRQPKPGPADMPETASSGRSTASIRDARKTSPEEDPDKADVLTGKLEMVETAMRQAQWDSAVLVLAQLSPAEQRDPHARRLAQRTHDGILAAAERALDTDRTDDASALLHTAETLANGFEGLAATRAGALRVRLAMRREDNNAVAERRADRPRERTVSANPSQYLDQRVRVTLNDGDEYTGIVSLVSERSIKLKVEVRAFGNRIQTYKKLAREAIARIEQLPPEPW